MGDNSTAQMSVHDQLLILDKVNDILGEIEYYHEEDCSALFNGLYNTLNEIHDDLEKEVRESVVAAVGDITNDYESAKNSIIA